MKYRFSAFPLFLILISSLIGLSCSSHKIDDNNPTDLYKDAEEDIHDKRYHYALEKLKNIKNKFPYSHVSTQAQLRIADVHYLEENYVESANAYETFRDLHPKHERADYVLFRIGESYYFQLPSTDDRDMSAGPKALEAFRELLSLYPNSEFTEKAKTHLEGSIVKLAEKEIYIADFYYSQDIYDSAARRYEKVVKNFSDTKFEEYAYWRWGQSLIRHAKNPEALDKKSDLVSEAKHIYRMYLSKFPGGEYAKKMGNWIEVTERQ